MNLDRSVLVAALTNERATERVLFWLAKRERETLLISEWTITEMSSALGLKVRTGQIAVDEHAPTLAKFNQMLGDSLKLLKVESSHFERRLNSPISRSWRCGAVTRSIWPLRSKITHMS